MVMADAQAKTIYQEAARSQGKPVFSLTDGDGNAIESGDATQTPAGSGRWTYAATAAVATGTTVRIEVTATDRAGGEGQVEQEKVL